MILQFWLMLPYDSSVFRLAKTAKKIKFSVRSKDYPPSHGGPPTQIRYVRERRNETHFSGLRILLALRGQKKVQPRFTEALRISPLH